MISLAGCQKGKKKINTCKKRTVGINELKWAEFAFRNKFEYYPALHDANLTTEM